MYTTLNSPLQTQPFFSFQLQSRTTKPTTRSSRNSLFPRLPFSIRVPKSAQLRTIRCSVDNDNNKLKLLKTLIDNTNDKQKPLSIAKPIAFALFYVVLGVFCPIFGFKKPAFAAVVAADLYQSRENEEKGHEYSHCTRRLLEFAIRLVKKIEEGRKSSGEDLVGEVEEGLKEVKMNKKVLQEEIMSGLYAELRILKMKKEELMDLSEEIVKKVYKAKREEESLVWKDKGGGDKIRKLREERRGWEKDYIDTWDRIEEIEDLIARRETMALSIGVRELISIERECEKLCEGFLREMRRDTPSSSEAPVTKLSKAEIQKELQQAHRQLQEQIVLPTVLESEVLGSLSDPDSTAFALRIQQVRKNSREMQKNLEAKIRKSMKKHGDERRFVAMTPQDEVVKGYPDIEMKWMFGKKEVVTPKAMGLHLFHGWKRWREDAKRDLKRSLLEDPELGKQYVAERQERILLDRDRVASRAWYDEQRRRWELDPIAVPYAVSKKLVEKARIRHDWASMYVTLKGNDKEYHVNIREYEALFEDFGGFDAMYLRMIATGVPTSIQLMWIPLSELDLNQQFLLLATLFRQCATGLWTSSIVSRAKVWTLRK